MGRCKPIVEMERNWWGKRYPNGNDYTEIRVALYEKDAKGVVRSGIVDINESGQIAMKEEGTLVHVGSTHT
jgi:hypothetical protein